MTVEVSSPIDLCTGVTRVGVTVIHILPSGPPRRQRLVLNLSFLCTTRKPPTVLVRQRDDQEGRGHIRYVSGDGRTTPGTGGGVRGKDEVEGRGLG